MASNVFHSSHHGISIKVLLGLAFTLLQLLSVLSYDQMVFQYEGVLQKDSDVLSQTADTKENFADDKALADAVKNSKKNVGGGDEAFGVHWEKVKKKNKDTEVYIVTAKPILNAEFLTILGGYFGDIEPTVDSGNFAITFKFQGLNVKVMSAPTTTFYAESSFDDDDVNKAVVAELKNNSDLQLIDLMRRILKAKGKKTALWEISDTTFKMLGSPMKIGQLAVPVFKTEERLISLPDDTENQAVVEPKGSENLDVFLKGVNERRFSEKPPDSDKPQPDSDGKGGDSGKGGNSVRTLAAGKWTLLIGVLTSSAAQFLM